MSVTAIDAAYGSVQSGDHRKFADWVRLVEHPLRASLRAFARQVDVEAIVQETLLRMWVLAPRLVLSGENASLRYGLRLARNLALREAQRHGALVPLPENDEPTASPDALPDPALRRVILRCIRGLPSRPREALKARLGREPGEPDRLLAERLGMRVNTFLQNVVRARRLLAQCLESHRISLREILR